MTTDHIEELIATLKRTAHVVASESEHRPMLFVLARDGSLGIMPAGDTSQSAFLEAGRELCERCDAIAAVFVCEVNATVVDFTSWITDEEPDTYEGLLMHIEKRGAAEPVFAFAPIVTLLGVRAVGNWEAIPDGVVANPIAFLPSKPFAFDA